MIAPRFLPWLRTGLAAHIETPAQDGLATEDSVAAVVAVRVRASGPGGETVTPVPARDVPLAGPGSVLALDPAQVLRRDPPPGTADAEPEHLALVELAAPDLPWRFTPAAATDDRVQPWLALVVVEERDGVRLEEPGGSRLPVLHVDDADAELPPLAQCWAWAHVQAEHDLADGVDAALAEAPEAFRARLLSPRRLTPGRSWIACVVPTFAAGRLAGLRAEAAAGAGPAWVAGERDVELPVYDWWRFSTGAAGDFESLVRRLRPRELPGSVGRRDLDVGDPGGGLPRAPGMLLSFEGALVSPAGAARAWPDRHRDPFKAALRKTLNAQRTRSADPVEYDARTDDPVVGPPAYAATQAGRRAVPAPGERPDWFEQLATEPVPRAIAGLGAEVVRRDQESFMAAAWEHAAGVRDARRALGRARTAWELARRSAPGLAAFDDARLVQLAAPAGGRLAHPTEGTVRGAIAVSALPAGLVSSAFRRLTHVAPGLRIAAPEGRVASTDALTTAALADPIGFVSAWATVAPPRGADLGEKASPENDPRVRLQPVEGGVRPDVSELASRVDRGRLSELRAQAAARIALPRPVLDGDLLEPHTGDLEPLAGLATVTRSALDGAAAIEGMVAATISGLAADRAHPVPAGLAALPRFTTPMYERLRRVSVEYLVPGIGEVPDDTLGLLEVNRPFLEAFLGGLNHELGREFAWREYPARLSATWARRFWDSGPDGPDDVVPIGAWPVDSALGRHAPAGVPAASLVLLIRGALPRRHPDLRIYAVEAAWEDARRTTSKDAVRREAPEGEVRLPVLAGALGPDTTFYGFALTEKAARGSTDPNRHPGWFFALEERPGAVRFGLDAPQARFRGTAPARWTALSWSHLVGAEDELPGFVDTGGPEWLLDAGALPGNGGKDAWGDDAAAMARITFQRPVRMLVHASSMLPEPA